MAHSPDTKFIVLSPTQVGKALLTLFKEDIRSAYAVETFALTGNGKFVVKLTRVTSDKDRV